MLVYHCDKCDCKIDNTNAAQLGMVDHSALCQTCYKELSPTPEKPEETPKEEQGTMDVSKSSTSAYPTNTDPTVPENIRNFWKQVEEEKIKKFNKELEEKGI